MNSLIGHLLNRPPAVSLRPNVPLQRALLLAPHDNVIHAVDREEGGTADSARGGSFAPFLSWIQLVVKRDRKRGQPILSASYQPG